MATTLNLPHVGAAERHGRLPVRRTAVAHQDRLEVRPPYALTGHEAAATDFPAVCSSVAPAARAGREV
ncbi:hypothetical protein AB0D57_20535 [Streptomyces sp. NPDC048275]|uniref:hypothetical protein n=1 Tax=Streptomyces sp. NPDC048275 TaxID=3155629 RepID=UPI0033EE3B84